MQLKIFLKFEKSSKSLRLSQYLISVTVRKLEEEHSATDENSSTFEHIKIEEMFLTSVSQDLILGSTKKTKSEFERDSDEISSKSINVLPESSIGNINGSKKTFFVKPSPFGSKSVFQTENIKQEIKSKESGEESGTVTAVAVEEEATSIASTSQSPVESFEIETNLATATEIFTRTSGNDELDATIQPDLISSPFQTPLNVPTDNSEFSDIDGEISSDSSTSVIEEPTQTSKIEFDEGKNQKEDTEFQEEAEPTTISSDITITPISSRDVTDDIAGLVAAIAANISSNIPKTDVKETTDMSEESNTESHEIMSSSPASESAVLKHVKAIEETPHTLTSSIIEETASLESDGKVTSETGEIIDVTNAEAATKMVSIAKETSASMNSETNIEAAFGILGKASEVAFSSESVSNLITEQPFLQENINEVIKKVAQSKDILVTDIKSSVEDGADKEKAIKKLKGEDEMAEGDTDTSNIANTLLNGGQYLFMLLFPLYSIDFASNFEFDILETN